MRKLLTILLLLYSSTQLHGNMERWSKASPGTTWIFEIKNTMENEPIFIQLLSSEERTDYVRNFVFSGIPPVALMPVDPKLDPWDNKGLITNEWSETTNANTRVQAAKGKDQADAGYIRLNNFFNPKEEYRLLIWTKNKPDLINSYKQPTYSYLIKPNAKRERIFLTWENNKLRPQKGTISLRKKGIPIPIKKSSSGVSLENNVLEKDIVNQIKG